MTGPSYMTIKELSNELNVSKTAINKKVDDKFKSKHFSKIGNQFVIDNAGQTAIKSMFKTNKKNDNKLEDQLVFDTITLLKDNLERTEEQLKIKDQQIETLQKLLDQQQVLTLHSNKKIEQLEMKQNTSVDSFWNRIFRK